MINLLDVLAEAAAQAPRQGYLPQNAPDLPLFKAVINAVDSAVDTAVSSSSQILFSETYTGTITADATVSPFTVGTVVLPAGYVAHLSCEITATTAGSGVLTPVLTWQSGTPPADTSLTLPTDLSVLEHNVNMSFAAARDGIVTLEWATVGFGSGSASYRIIASFLKLF
jgi:hypothetical protein